jgi:hypothetical protein
MFSFHYHKLYVWFVVRNVSVSLNLLIPQYGYVAFLSYYYYYYYYYYNLTFKLESVMLIGDGPSDRMV